MKQRTSGQRAPERDVELANLAKALAHPTRVHILRLLLRRTECVCGEVVDYLGYAQSTVSEHLRILKEAGLIEGTISGPSTCYCVRRDAVERLLTLMGSLSPGGASK
jgi:ArsR family transcriptional regulator